MQRKNCYIVDSCLRKLYKGLRLKNHSNAKGLAGRDCRRFKVLFIPPPLPQPLSTPAGGIRGAQQPYAANALYGVAFTRNGQHSNSPGTKDQVSVVTLPVVALKVGRAP